MSATTFEADQARARRDVRWLGAASAAFAVAVFSALPLTDQPDMSTSSQDTLAYFGDDANRVRAFAAAFVALVAAGWFLAMLGRLVPMLVRYGERAAAVVTLAGGSAFVTLYLAAYAALTTPAALLTVNNEPVALNADFSVFARAVPTFGDWLLLLFCEWGAAGVVAAVSVAGHRSGLLPRWLQALGLGVAAALILPLPFYSLMLLILWALTLGLRLLLRPAGVPTYALAAS